LPGEPIELKSIFGEPLSVPPKAMLNIADRVLESADAHPSSSKAVYGDEFITEIPLIDLSIRHKYVEALQEGACRHHL